MTTDPKSTDFPLPDLGQAILDLIAQTTGRKVTCSSITVFDGESLEVAAVLRRDGSIDVAFRHDQEPLALFASDYEGSI